MKCDECHKDVTPRRCRQVEGCVGPNALMIQHTFCLDCHGAVFTAADWRKYPGLFGERREWKPELAEWSFGEVMAKHFEMSVFAFANKWNAGDGEVFGIEFERAWDGESKRWMYRGIEPCQNY